MEGFAKLTREGIIVGVGRAVTLNIELPLATLSDAVTVSGESPVVDIQNANLGVNFDQDTAGEYADWGSQHRQCYDGRSGYSGHGI